MKILFFVCKRRFTVCKSNIPLFESQISEKHYSNSFVFVRVTWSWRERDVSLSWAWRERDVSVTWAWRERDVSVTWAWREYAWAWSWSWREAKYICAFIHDYYSRLIYFCLIVNTKPDLPNSSICQNKHNNPDKNPSHFQPTNFNKNLKVLQNVTKNVTLCNTNRIWKSLKKK